MPRAIIEKTILDALIRAKVATLDGCKRVEPLPVAWRDAEDGCNWHVPGWVGDAHVVSACKESIENYVAFLQAQFNIPNERSRSNA